MLVPYPDTRKATRIVLTRDVARWLAERLAADAVICSLEAADDTGSRLLFERAVHPACASVHRNSALASVELPYDPSVAERMRQGFYAYPIDAEWAAHITDGISLPEAAHALGMRLAASRTEDAVDVIWPGFLAADLIDVLALSGVEHTAEQVSAADAPAAMRSMLAYVPHAAWTRCCSYADLMRVRAHISGKAASQLCHGLWHDPIDAYWACVARERAPEPGRVAGASIARDANSVCAAVYGEALPWT